MSDAPQGWYPHEGQSLRYRVAIRFGEEPDTMPSGWKLGRVSAVAAGADGLVYVFHRGDKADPMLVFDRKGTFVRSWGKGFFGQPHGLRIDTQGRLWVTDCKLHQVFALDARGKVLLSLGTAGTPGCDGRTFHRPTDVAFAPDGGFYVTDGYGNARVLRYSPDGKLLGEWGRPGSGPGEFKTPHAAATDSRGRLYVSDRENNRIQIFAPDGTFLAQWRHLGATQGIAVTPEDRLWVVTHRNNVENATRDTLAGRLMEVDIATGRILASTETPGHWVAVSGWGDIFIGSLTGNVFRWYPDPA